ncbi:MAG: hypothetical protein JHC35_06025 [Sulfuricurvum sp.]|jgi:hypothetical protein|uniref:hypothetical protein n=1 Tax=Sulfuricurvum sp. TaxID=2025608 RepID=UPI0025D97130|nr:hypothetical protein [Sulfuricurvum sp.]MCI4406826.1 hypothetical protein [Sulfuricurvum sp.]
MSIDINMREKNYKDAQRLFINGLQKPHSNVTGKKAEENFEFVTKYLASSGDQESKWMIETANNLEQ